MLDEEEKDLEDELEDLDNEIMADLDDLDGEIEKDAEKSESAEEEVSETDGEEIVEEAKEEFAEGEEATEEVEGEEIVEEAKEELAEGEEATEEVEGEETLEDSGEEDGEALEGEEVSEEALEAEAASEEVDEETNKKNIVEAALFVAGRPVSMEELNIKTDIKKSKLEAILNELMMDYLERPTSLEIIKIQDKYSLQIKPQYTPNVKKFASGGLIPDRILKSLTIIALKQPIMKSMLVKLRGSGAYEHVKFLLDRGFIETRKKGRSHEILTTDQFADTFGLSRDIDTLKKQLITQLGVKK